MPALLSIEGSASTVSAPISSSTVPTLSLHADDVSDFDRRIERAIDEAWDPRGLYLRDKWGRFVVSYDSSYRPFLGYTHGYNHGEGKYVRSCQLLTRVAHYLRRYRAVHELQSGGRVFLDRWGVIVKPSEAVSETRRNAAVTEVVAAMQAGTMEQDDAVRTLTEVSQGWYRLVRWKLPRPSSFL